MNNYRQYLQSFYYLLKMDLIILFNRIYTELFDNCIWISISVFCNGYIMPALGLTERYGAYLAVGQIVSCCVFIMHFASGQEIVRDFENEKTISFELMLPIP